MASPDQLDVGGDCRWVTLGQAFRHYALFAGAVQSQRHIKPLHWHVACRLVVEGGFHPDDVTPRPPFAVASRRGRPVLILDPARAGHGERTVLGGLKTKNVDVVVTKEGLGPVIAVSCKGAGGAFRNLTNRIEEAVGDCTNLHITYPAMVLGFLAVLRANRRQEATAAADVSAEPGPARPLAANDVALGEGDEPVTSIVRYHNALRELAGRRGIRDDVSRYEAVSLTLVGSGGPEPGAVLPGYPPAESPLRVEGFFATLYRRYDERYVYAAPDLLNVTRRREWSPDSPALADLAGSTGGEGLGLEPRLADPD